MKEKILKSVLFLVALVFLQQGIALGSNYGQMKKQVGLIKENNIDPSALFYMESTLALRAEKKVRKSINKNR